MAYQSKHTGKQIDDGIDAVGSKLGRTDDLTNNVVTFVEAGERTDIASGETTGTLFGKILRWLKSLGKTAFSDDYNDLTNKPTKLSEFTNDAGYLKTYTETDPTVPTHVKNITQEQINAWNNPSKYTLPTASADTLGGVKVGAGLAIDNGVLSATGTGGISSESDPTVPSWAKQPAKPTYTKSEVGLGNVDNVKQYSASNPPPYPVTSVNGQTGAVTISVPLKTSDLANDTKYATEAYVDNAVANAGGEISNSATTSIPIYTVWVGTQEQYEAITTLDANTEYNIIEE